MTELSTEADRVALRYMMTAARDPLSPAQLAQAVEDCARHVIVQAKVEIVEARRSALAAWAALEAGRTRCRVDFERSSPHLICIEDTMSGVRHTIPVVELVRYIGPRLVA